MDSMTDVVNRHCEFSGCTKTPSYGYAGERAQFCSHHHLPDMEDVKNRRCEWHECRRYPIFGNEGERARFCSAHKTDDMVNVRNRRCEDGNCTKLPTHGFPGEKARCCLAHVKPGMVNLKVRKSVTGGAAAGAAAGAHHKQEEDDMHAGLGEGAGAAGMAGAGRQPGPDYGVEVRSMLGGVRGEAEGDRLRVSGYWGLGPRGPAGGGDGARGGGSREQHIYGGRSGVQGGGAVMGWGGMRGGGSSSGDVSPTSLLAQQQQRKYGSGGVGGGVDTDDHTMRLRRLAVEVEAEERSRQHEQQEMKQQHIRSLQSIQRHRGQGRHMLGPGMSDDQFYGQDEYHPHGQHLPSGHGPQSQHLGMSSQRSQSSQGYLQGGGAPSGLMPRRPMSIEMQHQDMRQIPHSYREQQQHHQQQQQQQQQHQHQHQQSRRYGNTSPYNFLPQMNASHGYGPGSGESEVVSGAPMSGVLGGRATLRPPQPRIPVAQPRARRPLPASPGRGVHGISGGVLEGALESGRQGGSLSPFVGHQPSSHLRLPLPPVAPSFAPNFHISDWEESHGHDGDNSGGAGGGGRGGGGGGGEGGGGWARDTMGHVEYSHQTEGGVGGGGGGGGASSLVMEGGGGAGAGFGSRLGGVDLGPGLMPPFDRIHGMADVRDASPGPFLGEGGGGGGGERAGMPSPPGSRPLSPLMTALGESGESPPGLPRLRTLNSRGVQDSHSSSLPYSPPYLAVSSAAGSLPPTDFAGLHQDMPAPASVSSGAHARSSPSFEGLTGGDGDAVIRRAGGDSGGASSRERLDASGSLQGQSSAGRGEEDWVPPDVVGGEGAGLPPGGGGTEGVGGHDEDEDPRKRLRIEELLH